MRQAMQARLLWIGAVVLLGLGAALLGVTWQLRHRASDGSAPPVAAPARNDTSFAFAPLAAPRSLPEIRFVDGDGTARTLADYRGRPILLNIWATWCVPCRAEMPSLDRLQAKLGPDALLVLPLSIDRQGMPAVRKFYGELGLHAVGSYLDQSGEAAHALQAVGVPTTLLIDRAGREIGRKIGAAEWDSPELVRLIERQIGTPDRRPDEAGR
jgi:thiol-disulfide isomerase/thioredoxin